MQKVPIWLKRLLAEITKKLEDGLRQTPIGCNNQGAVKLIESGVVKAKSKHIAVKNHHIHNEHKKGEINVYHISSEDNVADPFTKALPVPKHERLTSLLGFR
jgi:hypothetical protein